MAARGVALRGSRSSAILETATYEGPLGAVELWARDGRLWCVRLCRRRVPAHGGGVIAAGPAMGRFIAALERYFGGAEPGISARELDLEGVSSFARRVYEELMKVRFGELTTYGELARRVGVPGGARAVGGALGRNPLAIFIPCHRVVAAGGRLGGFGAGPGWKRRLLEHEGWRLKEGRVHGG